MENKNSIKELINNSLEQVRSIIDADTVMGKPISTSGGTTIIPISKVSMGFASGGLDMPNKDQKAPQNFGGGGGTGVTVSPVGFLTIYADGRVEMLPLVQDKATPIEQVTDLLEHAPSIINRLKAVIAGEKLEGGEVSFEDEYNELMNDEKLESELSPRELKKLRRQQEKAAKKAAKED